MPAAILALTLGGILVFSALKGIKVTDVLAGVTGDPLDASGHHLTALAANINGAATTLDPNLAGSLGSGFPKGPEAALLGSLASTAQSQYHLKITATTNGDHVSGSYHYQGRAFDASGSEADMHAFAQMIQNSYTPRIKELIHNPGFAIKDGKVVSPIVYTAVWLGHRDHVHVAA